MWIAKGWISDISEVSALRQSVFVKCQHHCTTHCQIPLSGSRGNDNGDDKRTKCKALNNAFVTSLAMCDQPMVEKRRFDPVHTELDNGDLCPALKKHEES